LITIVLCRFQEQDKSDFIPDGYVRNNNKTYYLITEAAVFYRLTKNRSWPLHEKQTATLEKLNE
jgi:hypothetical protein